MLVSKKYRYRNLFILFPLGWTVINNLILSITTIFFYTSKKGLFFTTFQSCKENSNTIIQPQGNKTSMQGDKALGMASEHRNGTPLIRQRFRGRVW